MFFLNRLRKGNVDIIIGIDKIHWKGVSFMTVKERITALREVMAEKKIDVILFPQMIFMHLNM